MMTSFTFRCIGVGNRVAEHKFEVANSWDSVRVEVIPGKLRINLYLNHDSRRYKLEVFFEDIRNCYQCSFDGAGAILLQVSCSRCLFIFER